MLAAVPVPAFEKSADALAALSMHLARGDVASAPEPWLRGLGEDFWVPGVMMPAFLEALGARAADDFIGLCRDYPRIAATLGKHPRTLCHGDLRRANIAFIEDEVVLFDWEFSSHGPAARDLQWYWFLQFWAYPPEGAGATGKEHQAFKAN